MAIQIISISHKAAPLRIREKFAFTKEQQIELMKRLVEHPEVDEALILSTCNRTELYAYVDDPDNRREAFRTMEKELLTMAGARDEEDISDYILFFHGDKAIHHLFRVATGLDSMVVGEDQILGQVKTAHSMAIGAGTTGVYLNTFFRDAVTGAKKVKTATDLSKTSVSTATLAIKAAEDALGTLKGKKVMVIGATGKIGGVVLMNLVRVSGAEIYVTTRGNKVITLKHGEKNFTILEYEERYDHIDEMDVIISATSSPHYVLTCNKVKYSIKTDKPRVFVDLAVPMDIEKSIADLDQIHYYNIDDFERIAEKNNRKKQKEAELAEGILGDYELQFRKWMIFQKALPVMREEKQNFRKMVEFKGLDYALNQFYIWVRENNSPEDLEIFFRCIEH
ncbi:MAG: glutamyl-tRNA reductase [Eubacterium sp.]|nr:glutamyl-tRNA reductase [Eubacterium sp.]